MKELSSKASEFPSDCVCALRAAIISNNDAGIETACAELKPYIQSVARTYCKTPAELPRFEQAALLTILRAAKRFQFRRGKPIEHLIRVAVRRAMLDELKSDATRNRRIKLFPIFPGEEPDAPFQNTEPSPVEILTRSHLVAQVRSWLDARAMAERELIELLFFEDVPQAEIARRFGVSRAAITKRRKSTFARARVELAHLSDFFSVN